MGAPPSGAPDCSYQCIVVAYFGIAGAWNGGFQPAPKRRVTLQCCAEVTNLRSMRRCHWNFWVLFP